MTVTFPENLLIDMYGEDTPLQINRDTGIMLERVIKENLSIKEANALLEYYRDACSLYELMSKYRCSAAEILHQRAAARRHLASYLYVTKSGVVGDNNAYPRLIWGGYTRVAGRPSDRPKPGHVESTDYGANACYSEALYQWHVTVTYCSQ